MRRQLLRKITLEEILVLWKPQVSAELRKNIVRRLCTAIPEIRFHGTRFPALQSADQRLSIPGIPVFVVGFSWIQVTPEANEN